MRVLWLKSDYILPPDTGGKIRTYNLLRQLRKHCEVTYVSFREQRSANAIPSLDACANSVATFYHGAEKKSGLPFYWRVLSGMRSRLPYIVQKYRSTLFRDAQRRWYEELQRSGQLDEAVIVCDFLEMTENVEWSLPVPKVLFQHNVESQIWRRYRDNERNLGKRTYFAFEHRRMRSYEIEACNRFDLVFTVSQEDKDVLQHDYGVEVPIEIMQTGIDTQYFAPRPDIEPQPGRMVFLGSLDWMPNIDGIRWFVSDVYLRIRSQLPHATLRIVGRRPTSAVLRLADSDAGIEIVPDVDDVRPHVAGGELFIVPLRIGGGSRIKIYEAMAMGRPVVSTSVGAEGLPLQAGEHLAVGDAPDEFARRVVELCRDHSAREQMAARGCAFVSANYPWSRIAADMYATCSNLVKAGGASAVRV